MAVRTGVNFSGSMTNGMVNNPMVIQKQIKKLEKTKSSEKKSAIILHRTVSTTLGSAMGSFESSGVGTHFIIGKNGAIYQTASLDKKTLHIRDGELLVEGISNANTIGIEVVGAALDANGNPTKKKTHNFNNSSEYKKTIKIK